MSDNDIQSRLDKIDAEEIEEVKTHKTTYFEEHPIRVVVISLVIILVLSFISTVYFNPFGINFVQQSLISIERAALYIMVSVGLTLTTRVLKFGNFAHAEFLTIGVYTAFVISSIDFFTGTCFGGFCLDNIFMMIIYVFVFTGLMGVLGEYLVFGPLRRRDATPLSLMVGSIGLGLVIRQVIAEIFDSTYKRVEIKYPEFFDGIGESLHGLGFIGDILGLWFNKFTEFDMPGGRYGIRLSRDFAWEITVMVLLIWGMRLIFTKTTLGISMRATADDASLAQISGINTEHVIYWTWFIAAGVTGVGAFFLIAPINFIPASGFTQLLIIFAVVTLGGFDSFEGTLVSGFIISFIQTLTILVNNEILEMETRQGRKLVFWSTNQNWSLAGPFFIIILVLILRPRGIFGLIDPKAKL